MNISEEIKRAIEIIDFEIEHTTKVKQNLLNIDLTKDNKYLYKFFRDIDKRGGTRYTYTPIPARIRDYYLKEIILSSIDKKHIDIIANSLKYKIGIVLRSKAKYNEEWLRYIMNFFDVTIIWQSIYQTRANQYENSIESVDTELIEALDEVMLLKENLNLN